MRSLAHAIILRYSHPHKRDRANVVEGYSCGVVLDTPV